MARILIAHIPKKLNSYWDDELNCVVDCWMDVHDVTPADIERVIIKQVVPFVLRKGCRIHIMDNSMAQGAFSTESVTFLKKEIGTRMATSKVKYLISISSQYSPLSNMSAKRLEAKSEYSSGVYWIEARNLDDALAKIRKIEEDAA
ncbi:hypothetical protein [Bdellovibrio sp. HCB209]|uniref:hypothetical protein n=1 Tax=Bdellovibrio sp. HCB209 TaxID=3394354 RepID=UPI0039B63D3E